MDLSQVNIRGPTHGATDLSYVKESQRNLRSFGAKKVDFYGSVEDWHPCMGQRASAKQRSGRRPTDLFQVKLTGVPQVVIGLG